MIYPKNMYCNARTYVQHELLNVGMYSLPSHLSQSSRDLILRMLVVDPMKRITIPGKYCYIGTHAGIRTYIHA